MIETLQLKKTIMRRVRFIYLFRKATSSMALQTYILSFFVWQLFVYVSMPHVLANMPRMTDLKALSDFVFLSFVQTEPLTQFFAVGAISMSIWTVRNIGRAVRRTLSKRVRILGVAHARQEI